MNGAAIRTPPIGAAGEAQGPLATYRELLRAGRLQTDPAQALAAERLQTLWQALRGYELQPRMPVAGLLGRLIRRRPVDEQADHPNGLYLVGEVGRGKSMLMDLFFDVAQVACKRRVHFHRFMQDAHARIHRWRQDQPAGADPIPPLADVLAGDAALLCFDEFQVNDIADAMILGRLFAALFTRGVVVVATSNTAPDALFAGQPGRDAFLPFIALLKQKLDLLVLEHGRDYRRERLRGLPTWHVPADARARATLDRAFARLTGGLPGVAMRLLVSGRTLHVPCAAAGVARFDFAQACEAPLGPGDYLALATHFHALVLDGIPCLGRENFDAARRLIILIDALYDHRVKLVASAAAEPDLLHVEGRDAVAFQRTASRLQEMASQDYLAMPHLP